MTRFSFRLESILQIKIKLEEQAKMEFATAKIRLNEEEDKLKALTDRKETYEGELRKLYLDELDIKKINFMQSAVVMRSTDSA